MNYETRTLKVGVCISGKPIFDNSMTQIEIVDEVAGEFLEITQASDSIEGKIRIEKSEWPTLKAAIEKMFKECRNYD